MTVMVKFDESTEVSDDDGDGYSEVAGDCHDGEATIHPDAEETPDGRDNDCDGIVDNGMTNTDDDGDGMTEIAGDCDDNNPLVGLGMEEIFDGVDNDCDGEVDEGVYDIDQDGFSDIQGDCDDNNGWANPDMEEMCDGFDNDCNGEIDEIALCSEEGEDNIDPIHQQMEQKNLPVDVVPSYLAISNSIPFEWLSLLLFIVPKKHTKIKANNKEKIFGRKIMRFIIPLLMIMGCEGDHMYVKAPSDMWVSPTMSDFGNVPVGSIQTQAFQLEVSIGTSVQLEGLTLENTSPDGTTLILLVGIDGYQR